MKSGVSLAEIASKQAKATGFNRYVKHWLAGFAGHNTGWRAMVTVATGSG